MLGFSGPILDPALFPAPFRQLTPAECEDCLCMLAGLLGPKRKLSRCFPPRPEEAGHAAP
jgi:hypothetical protein